MTLARVVATDGRVVEAARRCRVTELVMRRAQTVMFEAQREYAFAVKAAREKAAV